MPRDLPQYPLLSTRHIPFLTSGTHKSLSSPTVSMDTDPQPHNPITIPQICTLYRSYLSAHSTLYITSSSPFSLILLLLLYILYILYEYIYIYIIYIHIHIFIYTSTSYLHHLHVNHANGIIPMPTSFLAVPTSYQ